MSQLRTVQVLGGGSADSSARVSSLAAGLVARGVQVTVCGPAGLERGYGFPATGARFVPVPRRGDPAAVAALRAACAGADVVHAHGLHAAVRSGLALSGRSTPLVVTWYTHARTGDADGRLARLLERRAARTASVVLAASSDLVDRARRRGARDARLARAAVPAARLSTDGAAGHAGDAADTAVHEDKARAELGAVDRPLLVSAGALVPDQGYDTLLDAAHIWRELDPVPLLVIAGEGRHRAALQRRIRHERLPVVLLDCRHDLGALLAAADLAVLPGRWETSSALAHEALWAGVPLVAAGAGRTPGLLGDAVEWVPYRNAGAFARTVARLLGDPARREVLAAAGREQAAGRPTEEDTIAQVLCVYDEFAQPWAAPRTR